MFSVASIKARLNLRPDDTSRDETIGLICDGVRRSIENQTGFEVDAAEASRSQIFRNVATGKSVYTDRRPVGAIASVEAATLGPTPSWQAIPYLLVSAGAGELILTGSGAGAGAFPPEPAPQPWQKWRSRSRYDLVKVVYSTLLQPLPADLYVAMNDLAVFIYRRGQNSNLASGMMGDVSEDYLTGIAAPEHITGILGYYERSRVSWS